MTTMQPVPPPSIRRAVTLYRIDLAIGLVGTLAITGAFLATTLAARTSDQVRSVAVAGAVVGIVIGVGVAGFKLFLTSRVQAGRAWSRVAVLVLVVLGLLGLALEVTGLTHGHTTGYQWAVVALGLVGAVLSVWTVVLLFGQTPASWWR